MSESKVLKMTDIRAENQEYIPLRDVTDIRRFITMKNVKLSFQRRMGGQVEMYIFSTTARLGQKVDMVFVNLTLLEFIKESPYYPELLNLPVTMDGKSYKLSDLAAIVMVDPFEELEKQQRRRKRTGR